MTLGKPDTDLFYCLETSLHRPEVRTSPQQTADLLADEFVEFGKSGRVYNKEVTIDALASEGSSGSSVVPQVADFSVAALSNDVVLVRYRSVRAAPDAHKTLETLRSSIWKFNSGRWQMVFHQGTPIPHE
ncbi:nuclear transport factor 2 family protein [Ciceribacter selenitireducens]